MENRMEITENLKQKISLSDKFIEKLSRVVSQVYFNRLESSNFYGFLVIIEHLLMCLQLIISSYQDSQYKDYLNTKGIQNLLVNRTDQNVFYTFLILVIWMLLFLVSILFMMLSSTFHRFLHSKSNLNADADLSKADLTKDFRIRTVGIEGYCSKFINIFASFQRTTYAPIFGFFFVNSIVSVGNFSDSNQQLIMIVFILPLIDHNFQWSTMNQNALVYHGLLKILISFELGLKPVTQGVREFMIPYLIVISCLLVISNFKSPKFIDEKVQKIFEISQKVLLSVSFVCFFRVTFYLQLEELAYFIPLISFAAYSIKKHIQNNEKIKLLRGVNHDFSQQKLSISSKKLELMIKSYLQMLECESSENLNLQRQIIYRHRQQCSRLSHLNSNWSNHQNQNKIETPEDWDDVRNFCICKQYNELVLEGFNPKLQYLRFAENEGDRIDLIQREEEGQDMREFTPRNKNSIYIDAQSSTINLEERKVQIESDTFSNYRHNSSQFKGGFQNSNESLYLNQPFEKGSNKGVQFQQSQLTMNSGARNFNRSKNQNENSRLLYELDLENYAFSFETNLTVRDLNLEDYFVDKVYRNDEQNNNSNTPGNILNNGYNEITEKVSSNQKRTFKNQKEARNYIMIGIFEVFINELEQNQGLSLQLRDLESQLIYISFISSYLKKHYSAVFMLQKLYHQRPQMNIRQKVMFDICENLILREALSAHENNEIKNSQGQLDNLLGKGNVQNIDFSVYLDGNHVQVVLDQLYDSTSQHIIDFWSKLQTENAMVDQIIEIGRKVSQNVFKIKNQTLDFLNEEKYIKDLEKLYQYSTFFQEMLNDPITVNEIQIFIKANLLKRMNFEKESNQQNAFTHSFAQISSTNQNFGFGVVNAWGDQNLKWEFMFGNRQLCDMFKMTEEQIVGVDINSIMPSVLGPVHNYIIKKFYQDGIGKKLRKSRALIAKNAQGFLFPIKVRIDFYHHFRYGYSFIVFAEHLRQFNLYQEELIKIPMEEALLLMTDDRLNITDYSGNIYNFSGLSSIVMQRNLEMTGYIENLSNLITDAQKMIDQLTEKEGQINSNILPGLANRIVMLRHQSLNQDDIEYHDSYPCVLSFIRKPLESLGNDVVMNMYIILPLHRHPDCDLQMIHQLAIKFQSNTLKSAVMRKQSYKSKSIISDFKELSKNNIGSVEIQSPLPFSGDSKAISFQNSAILNPNLQEKLQNRDEREEIQSQNGQAGYKLQNFDIQSFSSASSGSSSSNSAYYAKNMLFKNKSPRILKISAFLISFIVLTFIIISSYNLSAFEDKYNQIQGRITALTLICQRNSNMRAVMLTLKNLQQIASDVTDFNKSNALPPSVSRLDFYTNFLTEMIDLTDLNSKQFDQFISLNKGYFNFDIVLDQMYFLTDLGYLYSVDNLKFEQASSTLTEYASSVSVSTLLQEKPSFNVTNYCKNYSQIQDKQPYNNVSKIGNRSLTTLERTLFGIFQNGIFTMEELPRLQYLMLRESSFQETQSSLTTLNLTTFISIVLIVLICLVVYPLITRGSNRVLYPIRIINQMDRGIMRKCQQNCEFYMEQILDQREKLKQNYQSQTQSINDKDEGVRYQDGQSIKIESALVESQRSNQFDSDRPFFQGEAMQPIKRTTQAQKSTFKTSSKMHNSRIKASDSLQNISEAKPSKNNMRLQPNKKETRLRLYEIQEEKKKSKIQSKDRISDSSSEYDEEDKESFSESEESHQKHGSNKKSNNANKHSNNLKARALQDVDNSRDELFQNKNKLQSKDKSHKSHGRRKKNSSSNQDKDDNVNSSIDKSKQLNTEKKQEHQKQSLNLENQINKISFKMKLVMSAVVLIKIMYFVSALLVSFFLSQQVFQNDKQSAVQLQLLFQREQCTYDLLILMREKAIQNRTLYATYYSDAYTFSTVEALYNMIDVCFQNENDIGNMRQNLPVYLKDFKSTLDAFESNQLCNVTFVNDSVKANSCQFTLDNIMQKGQGNALTYILVFIQQLNLNFDGGVYRDQNYLNQVLSNTKMQDMADLSFYYLKDSYNLIQQSMSQAVLNYFDSAKKQYLTAFAVYAAFTLFAFVVVGTYIYKHTRKTLLDMQNMLVLLPLDLLTVEQRQNIENYLIKS